MSARVVHRIAASCLDYPTEPLLDDVSRLRMAAAGLWAGAERDGLTFFLDWLSHHCLREVELHYVDVFDLSRRRALYLSYWTDGDTRRRGTVLAMFKQHYRDSGWLVDTHGELPDYLPMVLEYAALADPRRGAQLLQQYRPSLELLRLALVDIESPYAAVVAAVCATLPGASPADRASVHRMAAAGPPLETVGLAESDPRLMPLTSVLEGRP